MPADEGVAAAEHEREAPSPVQKPADAGVEHAFDQHVDGFTISTEAGFEHREARLHAEHEERAEQNPAGVDRVDDVAGRRGLVWIGRRGRRGWRTPAGRRWRGLLRVSHRVPPLPRRADQRRTDRGSSRTARQGPAPCPQAAASRSAAIRHFSSDRAVGITSADKDSLSVPCVALDMLSPVKWVSLREHLGVDAATPSDSEVRNGMRFGTD